MEIVEYLDAAGHSPFGAWFDRLPAQAAARVAIALARMEQGNLAGLKSVGGGVVEQRIDTGPGYRLYLGRDGDTLIVLLAGGTKRRQDQDIADAKARWQDYRRRRKDETPWR
jgi:putative addiction module killer protein